MHWSYIYLAFTHRYKVPIFRTHLEKVCKSYVIQKMQKEADSLQSIVVCYFKHGVTSAYMNNTVVS